MIAPDGTPGFGFTLGSEAYVARELAAWDARARHAGVPLARLLGAGGARSVSVLMGPCAPSIPDWDALEQVLAGRDLARIDIDPWAWGGIEPAQRAGVRVAQAGIEPVFVAPHSHPWEIAVCTALATARPRPAAVAAPGVTQATLAVVQLPGLGVDWGLEPGFAALEWQ